MLATVPDPLLDGLVAPTRLGAVLARRRSSAGETLTAVSRRCPPAWTPDRLSEVERGTLTPGADLVALVAAYGLGPGRWRAPQDLRLILDRDPVAPTADGANGRAPHDEPHWQLMRLAAVAVAVGLDGRWTGGRSRLLGEAFAASPREVAAQLDDALAAAHDLVAGWVERARALPVVAAAGVLLATGVGGRLVLTAPRPGGESWDVAPVCRLADLTPPA